MIPKSGYRFSEKIMLQHRLERDDDSKKSHPALDEKVLNQRQELAGLLEVRVVSRLPDDSELGLRNHPAECLAVVGGNDAVVLTPHEQRRNPHAMQPPRELGIVQTGVPAKARKGFVVAGDDGEL